jgi:murein L,D-transpeptidase YafK
LYVKEFFHKAGIVWALFISLTLAGCGGGIAPSAAEKPIPYETIGKMQLIGVTPQSPVLIRIFKKESELEIWKRTDDGRFALLKTYPICKWSGRLGPKLRRGDKQAPEGFYTVSKRQLNPRSSYHLSFNLGFPNALDKAWRRTGDYLMVHGDCRSAGCYAMTDALIEEIYAIVREALRGGQESFQVHAFPFRMNEENMARYGKGRWRNFWLDLKKGYDAFEMTHIAPKVDVCERRYLVNASFGAQPVKLSAGGVCPPYKTFVPEIMETPEGPKVMRSVANEPAAGARGAQDGAGAGGRRARAAGIGGRS